MDVWTPSCHLAQIGRVSPDVTMTVQSNFSFNIESYIFQCIYAECIIFNKAIILLNRDVKVQLSSPIFKHERFSSFCRYVIGFYNIAYYIIAHTRQVNGLINPAISY